MKKIQDKSTVDRLFHDAKTVHLIGVGGSGMCPMAEILIKEGYSLTGSDVNDGDPLRRVMALGVKVTIGHHAENVHGADLVVYSAAISDSNPELVEAERLSIPCIERSILLGSLTRRYSDVIGVSGTHGKTTVTSMITQILTENGFDPTAVIGGKLPLINGNGRSGNSDIMVCEACEFVNTFLELSPDHVVVTNIDNDHLDYFKTMENLCRSFTEFMSLATKSCVLNGDDELVMQSASGVTVPVTTFGRSDKSDFYAENVRYHPGILAEYDLMYKGKKLVTIMLNVPGEHNIMNSLAAAAVCTIVGATPEQIAGGLSHFKGAGRRFEVYGTKNGALIVDDYAHHPTEVKTTLEGCKKITKGEVYAVFQPFTFSRTALLMKEFAEALTVADHVILTPIMGSRETNEWGVTSEQLAALVPGTVVLPDFESIKQYCLQHAGKNDTVITMGGGDIYKAAKLIME